jgi:hypothetical protein
MPAVQSTCRALAATARDYQARLEQGTIMAHGGAVILARVFSRADIFFMCFVPSPLARSCFVVWQETFVHWPLPPNMYRLPGFYHAGEA